MHPKNDRFLVWARTHYGWLVEQMRGLDAGELALFVLWFIRDRLVYDDKPSYAYEIAWVFQRPRGTIGNVLRNLESQESILRARGGPKERRKLYLPLWEDVKSRFAEADSDLEVDGFVGDLIAFRKKIHDESCPCMTLASELPTQRASEAEKW